MKCSLITTCADLSEASLEDGMAQLHARPDNSFLVVAPDLALAARWLKGRVKSVAIDTDLPDNAWYVHNGNFGIFSEGV